MTKWAYEYRINKKGAECYRTESYELAKAKLDELNAKKPGIYTMQSRSTLVNKYGVKAADGSSKIMWGCWL